ncbi:MAG: Zn-ribbon domain-containing OB-fold protein [Nitrososphaerota archaeon]|nr:Zn-ribbon domain-containing OB-fold protein [Candidatus Bathyarchaeota archaeon]MDW8193399.1 Zn-ribbon domain-containing OB-fold protein [Nitrososphaerota archaeon]
MLTAERSYIRSREIVVAQEIPISRTKPFWDALKKGKILATKCGKCSVLYFPPVADCPKCLDSNVEWVELSGEATVETFTYVALRPSTFQQKQPYIVAVGKLKEGVKALAWLTGISPEKAKIGMKVRLVARVDAGDMPYYEFVPVDQQ